MMIILFKSLGTIACVLDQLPLAEDHLSISFYRDPLMVEGVYHRCIVSQTDVEKPHVYVGRMPVFDPPQYIYPIHD